MKQPPKPPAKPHRKGQKSYNQKSYEKRDSTSRPAMSTSHSSSRKRDEETSKKYDSTSRPPRDAVEGYTKKPYNKDARPPRDASEGYTKKPFRKREDNPLLESAPRPTRYAARFESKAKPDNSAGSAKETTPNSTRRGEVSARSGRAQGGSVQQVRDQLSTNTTTQSPTATGAIRLAKRMSDAGLCSRREAERHIEAGRVSVNGVRITACATLVSPSDYVRFDDKLIGKTAQDVRLFLFHKPRGALTTNADPEGRPTIYDLLPKDLPRVVSVGRLDFDSEGLLLLTTSGSLARTLELPATGLPRTYRVRVHGTPSPESLAKLKRGMEVDGVRYGSMQVRIEDTDSEGRNRWVEVTLREGKNREIRRVFTALEHHVTRLIRTHYGPFELGKLPRGALIEMKPRDWKKSLRDVLSQSE